MTFGKPALDRRALKRNAEKSVKIAGSVMGNAIITELDDAAITGLECYMASHEAAHVSHQMYLARALEQRKADPEELLTACREQIRMGLRNHAHVDGERLFELTEVVFREILQATQLAWSQ